MTTYTINPLGLGSTFVAVNAAAQIIGDYIGSDGQPHSFLDINGTITNIDPPGAISSSVLAISNNTPNGQVVGTANEGNSGSMEIFINTPGGSFNDAAFSTNPNVPDPGPVSIDQTGNIVFNNYVPPPGPSPFPEFAPFFAPAGFWPGPPPTPYSILPAGISYGLAYDTSYVFNNDAAETVGVAYLINSAGSFVGYEPFIHNVGTNSSSLITIAKKSAPKATLHSLIPRGRSWADT
jgi:hypothetical protein